MTNHDRNSKRRALSAVAGQLFTPKPATRLPAIAHRQAIFIGHDHGSSLPVSTRNSFSMTCKGRSRIAGNVLTPSRLLAQASLPPRLLRRSMSHHQKNQLWNRNAGIRFSPTPEPRSLYPNLEMSRFLHASSARSDEDNNDGSCAEEIQRGQTEHPDLIDASGGRPTTVAPPVTGAEAGIPHTVDPDATGQVKGEPLLKATPPRTLLDYKMSDDLFHAAKASPTGSPESFWSHALYRGVKDDGTEQKVKVHYCTSRHTMESVCEKHFLGADVVGFDLEWIPWATRSDGPRKNVSLIQLATPSRIALFHVALFPTDKDLIGPIFRKIMEDSTVTKVGVAILGDCTRLKNFLGVPVRGIFELSHLYKLVKHSNDGQIHQINRKTVSLSQQVEDVLCLPLYKGTVVRQGNWMQSLNDKQLTYAAADAYAGLQLFYVLEEQRKQLRPCPPRPHHAELGLPIRVAKKIPKEASDDSFSDSEIEEIMDEIDIEQLTPLVKPSEPASTPQKPPTPKPVARDARIVAAEQRMTQYRSSKQTRVATGPSALRAYYIWHTNDDLDPESIAKLLRDPPLQTNTVVTYILDAVTAEKLPYSKPRMSEVLSLLHPNVLANGVRYQPLVKDCQPLSPR